LIYNLRFFIIILKIIKGGVTMRKASKVVLLSKEREELEGFVNTGISSVCRVRWAKIILLPDTSEGRLVAKEASIAAREGVRPERE
jgi:hypothetical protein